MKLFYQALLVHILLNLYVFWRGWKVLPDRKIYKALFLGLFVFEFIVYIVGFTFGMELPSDVFRIIIAIGTSWALFIFYMTLLLLIYDVGKLACYIINRNKAKKESQKRKIRIRRIYYIFSILAVSLIMCFGYYHFSHPSVVEKKIVVNNSAAYLKKLRIVEASDLHIGYLNDKDFLKIYVDKIMDQKPDIILIAGDIVDYDLRPLLEQEMDKEFKRLKAPYGVYACLGNHEHYADSERKIKWLKEDTGITILQDSVVKIADFFYLVGREDRKSPRKPLKEIIKGIDKRLPIIVLNHQPNNLEEEIENNVDVAFYGHVHDGQVFPVNYVAKLLYELSCGYMKKDNTHIFISSGLGIGGSQYRIGTQSELLVVDVEFTSAD
ncbi:MAG: metallophosphoesterase [Dysgonomonas sp.]